MLDVALKTAVKEGSQRLPKAWVNIFKSWDPLVQKQLLQDFDPSDIKALDIRSNNHPEEVIEFGRNYNSAVLDKSQDGLDNSLAGISEISRKVRDEEFVGSQATPQSKDLVADERLPDQDAAEDWVREGGGRDQELQNILTVKRDSKKYGWKKGYVRSYEELPQGEKDLYDSMLATRWGDQPFTYKDSDASPLARTAEMKGQEGYKPSYHKSLEFHHKNMKALVSAFHRKLKEFKGLGKATDQDIIDLHRMDDAFGMESGSREAAALRMHRATHHYMHKEIMLKWQDGLSPVQPSHVKWKAKKAEKIDIGRSAQRNFDIDESQTKEIWKAMQKAGVETREDVDFILSWAVKTDGKIDLNRAIKKFQQAKKKGTIPVPDNKSEMDLWRERIENAKNPDEIKKLYQEMLEDISEPMTTEAELMERAARNQFTTEELMNPTIERLAAGRSAQIEADQLAAEFKKFKSDERIRQTGG